MPYGQGKNKSFHSKTMNIQGKSTRNAPSSVSQNYYDPYNRYQSVGIRKTLPTPHEGNQCTSHADCEHLGWGWGCFGGKCAQVAPPLPPGNVRSGTTGQNGPNYGAGGNRQTRSRTTGGHFHQTYQHINQPHTHGQGGEPADYQEYEYGDQIIFASTWPEGGHHVHRMGGNQPRSGRDSGTQCRSNSDCTHLGWGFICGNHGKCVRVTPGPPPKMSVRSGGGAGGQIGVGGNQVQQANICSPTPPRCPPGFQAVIQQSPMSGNFFSGMGSTCHCVRRSSTFGHR